MNRRDAIKAVIGLATGAGIAAAANPAISKAEFVKNAFNAGALSPNECRKIVKWLTVTETKYDKSRGGFYDMSQIEYWVSFDGGKTWASKVVAAHA